MFNVHKKDIPVPHHEYRIHHNGFLGNMKTILCLKLITHLHKMTNQKGYAEKLIIDDDSTFRKWCSLEKNGGHLADNIPQPIILADHGHRCKVNIKSIFKLVTTTRRFDEVKNIDALHVKKHVGRYINQHRTSDFTYFINDTFTPD